MQRPLFLDTSIHIFKKCINYFRFLGSQCLKIVFQNLDLFLVRFLEIKKILIEFLGKGSLEIIF